MGKCALVKASLSNTNRYFIIMLVMSFPKSLTTFKAHL
jgi:hypothetical protein